MQGTQPKCESKQQPCVKSIAFKQKCRAPIKILIRIIYKLHTKTAKILAHFKKTQNGKQKQSNTTQNNTNISQSLPMNSDAFLNLHDLRNLL